MSGNDGESKWPMPPCRVETERLVLRCYEPQDAAQLQRVTADNRQHLLPYMPWAHREPESLDEKLALILRFRGRFDLAHDFNYGVFSREEGKLIGGTGLHTRVPWPGLEVGYWISHTSLRQGFAREAAAAMVRSGFEWMQAQRVQICAHPNNAGSLGIPRRLGFRSHGVLPGWYTPDGDGLQDTEMWFMLRDGYPDSTAARQTLKAYDALGRECLAP